MSSKNKIERRRAESAAKEISDDGIKFLIEQAFSRRVRANRIRITTQNEIVKLWDGVPSFDELQKVENAVRGTRGVRKIEII